jgi:hypothetical protein
VPGLQTSDYDLGDPTQLLVLVLGWGGEGMTQVNLGWLLALGLGFLVKSPSCFLVRSYPMSLEFPRWLLTPTEETALDKTGSWILALDSEF